MFYIIVVDANNCSDTSEIAIVHTVPLTEIFVPSSFTPNGDFHNELFELYGKYIISFNLKIINRWGDLLYQTDNINKFWDGKVNGNLVPQGSYYYSINLIGEDSLPYTKIGVIDVLY